MSDDDFAGVNVDLFNADPYEFRSAYRGIEKQLEHDFALEIAPGACVENLLKLVSGRTWASRRDCGVQNSRKNY